MVDWAALEGHDLTPASRDTRRNSRPAGTVAVLVLLAVPWRRRVVGQRERAAEVAIHLIPVEVVGAAARKVCMRSIEVGTEPLIAKAMWRPLGANDGGGVNEKVLVTHLAATVHARSGITRARDDVVVVLAVLGDVDAAALTVTVMVELDLVAGLDV